MKIGLSYSRCIKDIVDGLVDIGDVLVVVTRTDFDPDNDEQWTQIWQGYRSTASFGMVREWGEYSEDREKDFRNVTLDLFNQGKMHQPRKFGAYPSRLPYHWLETVLLDGDLQAQPAVKSAWEQFQMLAGLGGVKVKNEDYL